MRKGAETGTLSRIGVSGAGVARPQSVRSRVEAALDRMTRSERRAAQVLLSHYPVAGLDSITGFAEAAQVSAATIQRLVAKIGMESYPEFRQALRAELADAGPLTVRRTQKGEAGDPIARFGAGCEDAIRETLKAVDRQSLADVVEALAAPRRAVYIAAGAFTAPLARHFDFHLRKMRPGVVLMDQDMAGRTDDLVNVRKKDVMVVFDIRRYQPDTAVTARLAEERGAEVVLLTDMWMSPIARIASHAFRAKVDAATPWDTLVGLAALVELIASEVDRKTWPALKKRLETLDRWREETFVPDRLVAPPDGE